MAEDSAAEISVKAAIVHKIAKFVSWPDSRFEGNQQPLRFCVLGDPMVLQAFEKLSDRSIHGRPLLVMPVPDPNAVASSCDVLYLGGDQQQSADVWIDSVLGQPVLTFGEAGEPGGEGSIVTMTIRRNKVRFSIDLDANKDTGLRISAQLLQLAASVGGSGS
ncbi:MAG: YfiR family protein [Gammaproteobacteria bacterium]|nr:YfiR family protein [Gammaproteobacteria bacterium]